MSSEDYLDVIEADDSIDTQDEDKAMEETSPLETYVSIDIEDHKFAEELASDDDMEQNSNALEVEIDSRDVVDLDVEELPQDEHPNGGDIFEEEELTLNAEGELEPVEHDSDEIIEVESDPELSEQDYVTLNGAEFEDEEEIGEPQHLINDRGRDSDVEEIGGTLVELDSEEEIENLEDDYEEEQAKSEEVSDDASEVDEDGGYSDVEGGRSNQGEEKKPQEEANEQYQEAKRKKMTIEEEMVTFSQDVDLNKALEITKTSNANGHEKSNTTDHLQSEDHELGKVPTFVSIGGDEFLLTPFFDECNYQLEDMISLFSIDEVSGKTLEQFFQLLRGNGDLIDAYSFNVEDELRLDFPELALSVTEDNMFTREMKLDDIIDCFYGLKANSEAAGDRNIPDKLTVLVSMQRRFVSRYKRLKKLVRELETFAQVNGIATESESSNLAKKRKLST